MDIFYRSRRIGKNGRVFWLYKFRTLKLNSDENQFASPEKYVKFGRILRKTKIDELPQVWNFIKRDINFFGYRPEEQRTWDILPNNVKDLLSKHRPGIIDLSSLHFFDEEKILQLGHPHEIYWKVIRPMKLAFQMFYIQNRCFLLNLAIIWIYLKKVIKSLCQKE